MSSVAKPAVVSTQRDTIATLDSFLRWHLHGAGFSHVYLYFDAPEAEPDALALARDERWGGRVTVFAADAAFRQREGYSALPSFDELAPSVETHVQSRQRLNCEHCLRACASAGVDWLLHVDSDELFVPAAGERAPAHFGRLSARSCWQFTYRNLEAVPTAAAAEGGDCFALVDHFKQHEGSLPAAALDGTSGAAKAALQHWLDRSVARLGRPAWYLFYSNGKSAVRVSSAGQCSGVHGWASGGAEESTHRAGGRWLTNLRRRPPQPSSSRLLVEEEGALVLHYACCTRVGFASKDWRALGYLDGVGTSWARRWQRMRDKEERTGRLGEGSLGEGSLGEGSLGEEHRALVGLADSELLGRHVEAGVLVKDSRVRRFLRGDASSRDPTPCGEGGGEGGGESGDEGGGSARATPSKPAGSGGAPKRQRRQTAGERRKGEQAAALAALQLAWPLGTTVEVLQRDEGYAGAWYAGEVAKHNPKGDAVDVTYFELLEADDEHPELPPTRLNSTERAAYLRPPPPPPSVARRASWLTGLAVGDARPNPNPSPSPSPSPSPNPNPNPNPNPHP